MAKIPGIVFLIVGGAVIFISRKSASMALFVYLGYLLVAYGSAKIIIGFVLKKDRTKKNMMKNLPENFDNPDQKKSGKQGANNLYGYIGYCPNCNTPMRKINNYCHICGRKQ